MPPVRPIAPSGRSRSGRRAGLERTLLAVARIAGIVALPFIAYVRGSVFFYEQGARPLVAVIGSALVTFALASLYVSWFAHRIIGGNRQRARAIGRWVVLPMAAAWCVYSAVYLARVNAKTPAVRAYYGSVNPILRVALATVILVDDDLVVTDTRRVAEDYGRMGLPVNERTLHYQRDGGWVNAVDLRTRGHNEIANRLVQGYFALMGFQTLRHVGTADHLHVQLPLRR